MTGRRAHPSPTLYGSAKAVLRRPVRRLWGVKVEGLERLPKGPFIVAANHRSFIDSVFLAHALPRPVSFLAKAEYWERPSTRWIFESLGQIPLRRGSSRGAVEALAAARTVLDGGGIVGIYPEGTRSRDGALHRGNTGVARLSRSAGVPIIPIGLVGTAAVQPPGARVPRLGKPVTIRIGAPQDPPPTATTASSPEVLRGDTDRLMTTIAGLCGQPYVDEYAPVPH